MSRLRRALGLVLRSLQKPPTFGIAFALFLLVSAVLYVRSPFSNSIFDEQEALLANPYVNGQKLAVWQLLERDFWGLPAERSIGSYRPLPNLLWRGLWAIHSHPWVPHALNVILHALNAALLCCIAWRWTKNDVVAWLSGSCFVSAAVLTETVSGAVGLADVLSGVGILLAIAALSLPLPAMAVAAFLASSMAMFSKESSLVVVAILPWAALLSGPLLHQRSRAVLRALVALIVSATAVIFYVQVRKRFFPSPIDEALLRPLPADCTWSVRLFHDFQVWFAQPKLPQDPVNNPLIGVPWPQRVATAMRIYLSGLGQVLFPATLSGDYSYAAELPERSAFSFTAGLGAALFALPAVASLLTGVGSLWQAYKGRSWPGVVALSALALGIIPVGYFPQSNIAVLLPVIRAERFWYLPVIGTSLLVACALTRLVQTQWRLGSLRIGMFVALIFLGFQGSRARLHALDYNSDVDFWHSVVKAQPNSAKGHLNYGVMVGARGDLATRLAETGQAMQLAPQWPMAHVYYGDALCRMQRAKEAWPHYRRGFELAPNDPNLIALGLQCLWDQDEFKNHQAELEDLAEQFPDSWLDYLATDTLAHGSDNGGVDKQYRPRGYDEGPK